MSWFGEDRSNGWHGDPAEPEDPEPTHLWPLTWRTLPRDERWPWLDRLWSEVCSLQSRYRLAVRAGWWEDEVQLEALAALAAWVGRYDSGDWDDPPGKLGLLFDLERVASLLRDGLEPFHPDRDRPRFLAHARALGCEPPAR